MLRRTQSEYFPSIDNYDLDDDDENYMSKKGTRFVKAAARNRRYHSYNDLNAEGRKVFKGEMKQISSLLAERVIRPKNQADYLRLRAQELASRSNKGAAAISVFSSVPDETKEKREKKNPSSRPSVEGKYDVLEYADLLSAALGPDAGQRGKRKRRRKDTAEKGPGKAEEGRRSANGDPLRIDHPHESRDTVFYQIDASVHEKAIERFSKEEMFSEILLKNNDTALGSLMQLPAYYNCETALDGFRAYYPKLMQKRVGEFYYHFFEQCGIKLFCIYVRRDTPKYLYMAFEMDGVQRYFLMIVMRLVDKKIENSMSRARVWCDEALETYHAMLRSTEKSPYAYPPCINLDAKSPYWCIFNITTTKSLQNEEVELCYAYYTTCQCVSIEPPPAQEDGSDGV